MYWHFFWLTHMAGNSIIMISHGSWYRYDLSISAYASYLSSPLLGLLADVWIGRYKAILIGSASCFLSWIILGIGYIWSTISVQYYLWFFVASAYFFQFFGYASFRVNIIQYNIDQLVGASADELSTIIYWHSIIESLVEVPFFLIQCLHSDSKLAIFVASGVLVVSVLVSHSFFKEKLEKTPLIKNPIKLIVRVLCYARKHKYPENRSALTYWEVEAPSRLDLGKEKYGGPFTDEEVEDVKTAFRMLPLFIAITGFTCSENFNWYVSDSVSLLSCLIPIGIGYSLCSVILFLAYLYLIRICFYKYIPSMLSRMCAGLLFSLAVLVSEVVIFNISIVSPTNNTILLLPQVLHGISFILVYPVSLEFTIAQSPVHMRGVMVGLWYASWGTGYLLNIILKFPFKCQNEYICTSFYYYLTKGLLVLIIMIVFIILAKCYKYRVRENEVNIVQIVDDHYHRYMEQERVFKSREAGLL